MPLILLAEDDPDLQVTTPMVLQQHGYDVVVAGDGHHALTVLASQQPDLALVDVIMPAMDGITLTRRIRAMAGPMAHLPIIMLTARDLTYDQIRGLEAGADDYVTKPFDGEVLVARIRSALRRATPIAGTAPERFGDLGIDRSGMVVTVADEAVELSATEFRLLEAFADHVGAVLSRSQLLDRVWGSSDWGDERVVDVNIQRLRAKIGADRILTVRGVGYKMPKPTS